MVVEVGAGLGKLRPSSIPARALVSTPSSPWNQPMSAKCWRVRSTSDERPGVMAGSISRLGSVEVSEFSPLQLLINTLNSRARQGEAEAFLTELAREPSIRKSLYPALTGGQKDEKMFLARIVASSGGKDSLTPLEAVSHDADPEVAKEGLRALQNLRARL